MPPCPKPPRPTRKPTKRIPAKRKGGPRPGRLQGAELAELREQCFYRDGGRCCECQRPVQLNGDGVWGMGMHLAHRQAKRRGGDYIDNVRSLCPSCHRQEHAYGKSGVKPVPPKEK